MEKAYEQLLKSYEEQVEKSKMLKWMELENMKTEIQIKGIDNIIVRIFDFSKIYKYIYK